MKDKLPSAELKLKAEFYDVDSMKVVWHGNYVRYMEQVRCVLLDKIGYNYNEMESSGYAWPIVQLQVKYIRPLEFKQEFIIRAVLLEYENRLKIRYTIINPETMAKINTAETVQMAIDMKTGESLMVSPDCLVTAVESWMKNEGIKR